MSCLVNNIGVSNLFEHKVSKTSLYEIHVCKLILSSSHKLLFSMEDNPPLVEMCWVVILIHCVTSRHIGCPYIHAPSMIHYPLSNYMINPIIIYPLSNHLISILIWLYFVSLVLSLELLDVSFFPKANSYMVSELYQILTWY